MSFFASEATENHDTLPASSAYFASSIVVFSPLLQALVLYVYGLNLEKFKSSVTSRQITLQVWIDANCKRMKGGLEQSFEKSARAQHSR